MFGAGAGRGARWRSRGARRRQAWSASKEPGSGRNGVIVEQLVEAVLRVVITDYRGFRRSRVLAVPAMRAGQVNLGGENKSISTV
jgi:hypothetical protein